MMHRKQFLKLCSLGVAGVAVGCTTSGRAGEEAFVKHWAWVSGGDPDEVDWPELFGQMREAGLEAALVNQGPETIGQLVPFANEVGLELHAWKMVMMQGAFEEEHPEWYAVNRNGVSTADDPPYVDYYKFMCPSREPVRQTITEQIIELAQVDGLASVHLDYIRYPDVILPIALQPEYDLVQDREYPEFDYCYCEVCRTRFEEQSGLDPLALDDPAAHAGWVQYRYDTITSLVNHLAEVVHARGKQITAAIFPTPDLARRLVRQDWDRWNLDAFLPMLYHNFYDEPVSWIEQATREGVEALGGRAPLYSGLFIPELSPEELDRAAEHARRGGADGLSLFDAGALEEEHWQRVRALTG